VFERAREGKGERGGKLEAIVHSPFLFSSLLSLSLSVVLIVIVQTLSLPLFPLSLSLSLSLSLKVSRNAL
jgi:hypothetical protein